MRRKKSRVNIGARFERQDWLGYVGQKNKVLSLAANEWVFSLDADEELSLELRDEIRLLKTTEEVGDDVNGFSMPRCVFYEARWIRHGDWYPDRLVRLFRRDRARFVGGKVHERLEINGRIIPLCGEIHHYSFRDAADHRARCEQYSRLWAQEKFESRQKCRTARADVSRSLPLAARLCIAVRFSGWPARLAHRSFLCV